MRMQQRRFVVEVKSSRRRQNSTKKSIWESTDLKALIRAAQADTEELFGPKTEVTVSGGGPAVVTDAPAALSVTAVAGIGQSSSSEDVSWSTSSTADAQSKIDDDVVKPAIAEKSIATPRSVRDRPLSVQRKLKVFGKDPVSAEQRRRIEKLRNDELAALEHENCRLKNMVRQRLTEENKTLWEMLERFAPLRW